jgi:hypothetical protein
MKEIPYVSMESNIDTISYNKTEHNHNNKCLNNPIVTYIQYIDNSGTFEFLNKNERLKYCTGN